ncbi:hypothetical protein [Gulosibacter molinativorax]|uniref:hypothetical protein n=1 Tax=Gulosibacter molinativorax TaxID=256821 RepID=UPI0012ECB22D|nr:hypothetical protein [Gulosibacter molinativorax]QUY61644.1 Hypotetical protein [Gulosibacter molinativorax]
MRVDSAKAGSNLIQKGMQPAATEASTKLADPIAVRRMFAPHVLAAAEIDGRPMETS